MAKILKNTTLSDIELNVIGFTIPASGQVAIPEEKYDILASEDSITELSSLIAAEDIVVNDGTNDLDADIGIEFIKYPDNANSILIDLSGTNFTGRNVKETFESISAGTGIPSISNKIYVAKNGNDTTGTGTFSKPFLTIKKAINYINTNYTPSSSDPYEIFIGPGTYSEDNPLSIPDHISIRANERIQTIITAANANENLINATGTVNISNVTLSGVTNSAKWLAYVSETNSTTFNYKDIRLHNYSNGLYIETSSGNITCSLNNILSVDFNKTSICIGQNTVCYINGYRVDGIQTGATGLEQASNSFIYASDCFIDNCTTGVKITGNTGTLQLDGISIENTTTPLNQTGTSKLQILGGNFDASTASVSDTNVIDGYFFNQFSDEKQLRVLNELSVGLHGRGKESSLGEGDSYYNGSIVYEYNGTTYTNVSTNSRDPLSGTFSIPGTAVDNAIYVSTGFPDSSGNPQPFPGIKIDVATAAVLGSGEIVAEYWNGSTWAEFNHMSQSEIDDGYNKYAKAVFERAQKEQILFDASIYDDWTANDPPSLGTNYYWMRFRVVTTITTAPVFNSLKVHTSRVEINSDGFTQYYGFARVLKTLSSDITFNAAINSPQDQDVYLSDNLAAGKIENEYYEAGLLSNSDQSGTLFRLPTDLCTSCPMKVSVTFISPDTGTATMVCHWNLSKTGDTIYQSSVNAPTTSSGEKSQTKNITYNTANAQNSFDFTLDVSDAIPRRSSGKPDVLWISLQISPNTTASPIVVTNVSLRYVSNEAGEHI